MKRKQAAEGQDSWEEARAAVGLEPGLPADKDTSPPGRPSSAKPDEKDSPEGAIDRKFRPPRQRVSSSSQEHDCYAGKVKDLEKGIPDTDSALLSLPMDGPQHNEADGDACLEVKEEVDEVETNPEKGRPDTDLDMLMSRALSGCPLDVPKYNEDDGGQLEEVKREGETNPGKGFAMLTQEEKNWLLTMPDSLKANIGFQGKPDKRSVTMFFERYCKEQPDHHFDTQPVHGQRGPGPFYQSRLVTPSLYGWTFLGNVCSSEFAAETSVCYAFWNDPRVQEIACKVPPATTGVKRWVTYQIKGPWKKSLLERGFNVALIIKEATHELYLQFKDMGCRLALWDGNA